MQSHLHDLRSLLQFVDIELYCHLVGIVRPCPCCACSHVPQDADNMYFSFRWILVDFKREAPMEMEWRRR